MQNKKAIYLLAPLAIIIWGIIGFSILETINLKVEIPLTTIYSQFTPPSSQEIEPFTIQANYRDPFLGSLPTKKTFKKPKEKQLIKKEIQFPSIAYNGMITSQKEAYAVYLITLNGHQKLFKKQSSIQGVTLLQGDPTKITVKYKNMKKTINRTHATIP